MSFSMAGGSYSYNRFNNFDKLVEGAKPDFLDMDKDGNKKESFKKAVKDKEKGCKDCGKEDCGCDTKKEGYEPMTAARKARVGKQMAKAYDADMMAQRKGDMKGADKQFKRRMAMDSRTKMKKESVTKEDVMQHLIDEGFVNNEVSAEVLFNHMSDDWLVSLETAIQEGMHRDAKTGAVVKKAEIGKPYYPNMPKRKTSVAIRKEKG